MALSVIDSHIHFWDVDRLRYPWLDKEPDLNHSILPDHASTSGEGWVSAGLVFVEATTAPSTEVVEAEWVTMLAGQDPRIRAIVAQVPLENAEMAAQTLEGLQALPLVKGVRRLIQDRAPGFCAQPAFVKGVQSLPRYGYSFDLCIRHHQMPEIITLVGQCPDVSFVLDHCGKPDIRAGVLDPWREQIRQLAAFPNVVCKVSGLVTEADVNNWQPGQLTPYIEHVVESFGIDRIMFGTDSPVLQLAHIDYSDWVDIALAAFSGLSDHEKVRVFHDNARAFYRLD